MDPADTIASLGTLVPTHALLRAGLTSHQLTRAVRRGEVLRVRQGWYASPLVEPDLLRGARVGGRITCVTAAHELGLATRGGGLHVEVPASASRLRDPDDHKLRLRGQARVHWHSDSTQGTDLCVGAMDSLRAMARCASPERTVAAVDSAIRLGIITKAEWMLQLISMPRRLRRLLVQVDGRAGSVTESVIRFRLAMIGIAMRSQVHITGVGAVDFLIGRALVIEVDGKRYHTDEGQFESDRRRDAKLSIRGYRVLRFSYRQVFEHWFEVRGAILAAIMRGDAER